jgi:hypothetical protein
MVTCPQRWKLFQSSRKNFEALGFSFPLRVFQTSEALDTPRVNACLNGRAALMFAQTHLPDRDDSWVLYLEDDVQLRPELPSILPKLVDIASGEDISCWYLCNRRVNFERTREFGVVLAHKLKPPIIGAQALLFPKRFIKAILAQDWTRLPDDEIFTVLAESGGDIFQVIEPVLAEHVGRYSTFDPLEPQELEINHADPPSCN